MGDLMKNSSKNDRETDIELSRLEAGLMSFSKMSVLDRENKNDMKRHLLKSIKEKPAKEILPFGIERLVNAIRKVARGVEIPGWASVMMKERILEYAESTTSFRALRFNGNFVFARKFATSMLLVVFAFTAVVIFPFKAPVTYAKSTFLSDISGEVYIKRKIELIEATPDMELEEGDILFTRGDSAATIQFFDDSLSRLSENTSVQVNRLYQEPINPVVTNVELFLEEGRLWAKVVNLMDESSFVVDTEDVRADVEKKAAFDIYVQDNLTEVAVYENVVSLVPVKNTMDPTKTVVAGYKAELIGDDLENITVEKLSASEMLKRKDVWVAANLTSDEEYDDMLIEDMEKIIEAEGGENVADGGVLSDPEAEEMRQKFLEAYQILLRAEAQLVRGARSEGIDGLSRFKWMTINVIEFLPELEARDPFMAEALRAVMKEKISLQLRDFASFMPGNSLYRAKETLQEIELALAESDVKRIEIQLAQAESILLEIEGLVADHEPLLASALLKRYQNRTNGISLELTAENISEVQDRFESIIEGQAKHIKALIAIENSIIYLDHNDLKEKVKEVREDTLRKFVIALEQMPESVPEHVLYDVRDLYATYVDEESNESDILADEQSDGVLFIDPGEELPSELGIFVMVPLEGSGDVKSEIVEDHIDKWAGVTAGEDDESGALNSDVSEESQD